MSTLLEDARNELRCCFILSRSLQKHASVAWSSGGEPSLPPALRAVVLARASFVEPVLSRFGSEFIYSFALPPAGPPAPPLPPQSSAVSAVVVSRSFAPEKLLTLARAIAEAYRAAGGNALIAQAAWLQAFAYGRVSRALTAPLAPAALAALAQALPPAPAPNAPAAECAWEGASFDPAKSFRPVGARALLSSMGVEATIVWTALMLRKRVAVVTSGELARAVRAARVLSLLVAHRFPRLDGRGPIAESPAAVCFPFVALSEYAFAPDGGAAPGGTAAANELAFDTAVGAAFRASVAAAATAQVEDLRQAATWVAGFTDPTIAQRGGELWDVCVDLTGSTAEGGGEVRVIVAEAAKAELAMSSAHKEVAKALVEALADPACTDATPLGAVAAKSTAIVDKIAAWAPGAARVDASEAFFAALATAGVPRGLHNFLFSVALAEPRLRVP
jgi:hypothetical protein